MMVIEEEWLIQSLVYTKSFPNTVQLHPEGCNVTLWSLDHKKTTLHWLELTASPLREQTKVTLPVKKQSKYFYNLQQVSL